MLSLLKAGLGTGLSRATAAAAVLWPLLAVSVTLVEEEGGEVADEVEGVRRGATAAAGDDEEKGW